MRRQTEQQFSSELTISEFSFLPRGSVHLNEIYRLTKEQFPHFCDDRYLCSEHCQSNVNQPEWKHVLRGTLNHLKNKNIGITKGAERGIWIFN